MLGSQHVNEAGHHLMHLTAMVIDDDPETRLLVRNALIEDGIAVADHCRHGVAACERARQARPDIVFVSVEEPIARSMLTVEFLRSAHPNSAVFAYSSDDSPALVRRVMRADVEDLLSSPPSRSDIRAAMKHASRAIERLSIGSEIEEPRIARVIAVAGQKGGIGKTTISTNVAAALASRSGGSVLLIDLDTRFGDVAIALDTTSEFTASQAARNIDGLDRETFRAMLPQHESGAYILPAPAHRHDWVDVRPQDMEALIALAAGIFDFVVIDTPGTLDEMVAVAIDNATRVIAVTSLDLTSIKNTNLLLAYLESRGIERDDVIVTVSHTIENNVISAAQVADLLETNIDFEVPYDRAIGRCSQIGRPITIERPQSLAAHAYAALAARAGETEITMPNPGALPGIFARVFGRKAAEVVPTGPSNFTAERPSAASQR
jgi:pilus assembly protein CpaE